MNSFFSFYRMFYKKIKFHEIISKFFFLSVVQWKKILENRSKLYLGTANQWSISYNYEYNFKWKNLILISFISTIDVVLLFYAESITSLEGRKG